MNQVYSRYRCPFFFLSLGLAWCLATVDLSAQIVQQAVGGIAVNADGVVEAPTIEDKAVLAGLRESALAAVPEDLQAFTDLRAVSLKQLEAEVAKHLASGTDLPESVRYLAGLQRVQYVFVYPEKNDVVIAGPAEGWRVDQLGNVVGATTGRPVLLLEDLVVALRARDVPQLEAISCSIDPTPEGMQRLRGVMRRFHSMGNPDQTMAAMEDALGPQVVSVTGVPQSSHFARTMVAADFRMKRLAMGFEPAPLGDMPSFMEMLASSRGSTSATPRWWLAPKYEPLARDAAGLAWELRGQGVQCLTEEDHFNSAGERQSSSKSGATATAWANKFTERFNELADHDSSFGALRNAMDLAVVAALLDKQGLLDKAELELAELTHGLVLSEYYAPRRVNSQATFVKRRKDFVVSASGGVQLLPWKVAEEIEEVAAVGDVRARLTAPSGNWTW
ncbi:DUF1598 domain-containing protein [Bythopirellula polymerisocia]|uniref:DUF1598 domain-containing protein n=1 Tax=Bythopirellula polymerisocia TaxID=2528003 RepID=A0A5C6CVI2_9BACT|nr:DUF1598 domain-containing protein [Bythopirellula polymerisocia]TWU28562.1 hypothetical protein Pla144_18530 [Bythopirellula polymerisocia]